MAETSMPGLERRLKAELVGEVQFDRFTRGRYATDASHYQIMPLGVVVPRTIEEAERALAIAREEGVSVLPRGGGTSQSGQTVNDVAGHRLLEASRPACSSSTSPAGAAWSSPASCSTSSTAGSSRTGCGFRSTSRPPRAPPSAAWPATTPAAPARCATATRARTCMSIDAVLADGARAHFGPVAPDLSDLPDDSPLSRWRATCSRSARARPTRSRRASRRCSAGSAATISTRSCPAATTSTSRISWSAPRARSRFSTRIELKLSPLLGRRAVGACHFGSFHDAMEAAQHIVKLGPIAVELVDRTMIGLARDIAMFQPTLDAFVRGDPDADPAGGVRRGRSGRESAPPAAARAS